MISSAGRPSVTKPVEGQRATLFLRSATQRGDVRVYYVDLKQLRRASPGSNAYNESLATSLAGTEYCMLFDLMEIRHYPSANRRARFVILPEAFMPLGDRRGAAPRRSALMRCLRWAICVFVLFPMLPCAASAGNVRGAHAASPSATTVKALCLEPHSDLKLDR